MSDHGDEAISINKTPGRNLRFYQNPYSIFGLPPTISEVQGQFSFKSPNAVQEHLKALMRKGHIRRTPNQWRRLELVVSNKNGEETAKYSTVSVPLIGRVTAGLPIFAEENFEGTISVDRSLVGRAPRRRKTRTFYAVGLTKESERLLRVMGFKICCSKENRKDHSNLYKIDLDNETWQKMLTKIGNYSKMVSFNIDL